MITRMQQRRGTSLEWQAVSDTVILASGEIGLETDTGHYKVGDGVTVWSNLPYFTSDKYNSDVYAKLNADQTFIGAQTFVHADPTKTPVLARGLENQTGNLQNWEIESTNTLNPETQEVEQIITEVASMSYDGILSASGANIGDISIQIDESDPENIVTRIRNLPNVYEYQDEAVSKAYVDTAQSGIAVKPPVRVATTGPITLSTLQTIDGISLVAGNRVLVKNQSDAKQNGIYVAATGPWTRALDTNSTINTKRGTYALVESGTQNENTSWVLTTEGTGLNGGIVFGTDELKFELFFNPGELSAGNGINKTGTTFSVVGTPNEIDVSSSGVSISDSYSGQPSITTVGTIAAGVWNGSTISVANGGTGTTSLTGFVYGNGTGAFTASPLISGSVINGDIGSNAQNVNGVVAISNGGTGATDAATARINISAAPLVSNKVPPIHGGIPTGAIMQWTTTLAPDGFLICDGSERSRSTYSELFAVIGTTYGSGNGSTTFNIPNLQGRIPVGRDSSDTNFDKLNSPTSYIGAKTHRLSVNELPPHNHLFGGDDQMANWFYRLEGFNYDAVSNLQAYAAGKFLTQGLYDGTSYRAGNQPHNNVQPYIVVNYIIKI